MTTELIKRRRFLSNLWKTGAAFIAGAGAWTTWDLIKPLPTAGFGGVVRAVKPEAVPDDSVVEVAAARAYLVKVDGDVVALSQKCTHLGCRVPFCASSGQFECPCHGSQYNRVGEKKGGPAPRGMDRFAMSVTDGVLTVNTGAIVQGPPIGTNTTGQEAEGPHCIGESSH